MTRALAIALVMFGLGLALLIVTLCIAATDERER